MTGAGTLIVAFPPPANNFLDLYIYAETKFVYTNKSLPPGRFSRGVTSKPKDFYDRPLGRDHRF